MKTINVAELNQKLKNGEKLHLVDVRETFEHDEFDIKVFEDINLNDYDKFVLGLYKPQNKIKIMEYVW